MEPSVNKHDINRGSQPLDNLNLKHGALEGFLLSELVFVLSLALPDNQRHQVRQSLSCDSRGGHQLQVFFRRMIVVESRVEALLSESQFGLVESILELIHAVLLLLGHGVLGVHELVWLPVVNSVDFVQSYDEWDTLGSEELHGLDRLVLETMHQIYHEDGEIAEGRASGTEVGEGLVPRGVDNQETWDLEVNVDLSFSASQVVL
jgi:hypothetical protein